MQRKQDHPDRISFHKIVIFTNCYSTYSLAKLNDLSIFNYNSFKLQKTGGHPNAAGVSCKRPLHCGRFCCSFFCFLLAAISLLDNFSPVLEFYPRLRSPFGWVRSPDQIPVLRCRRVSAPDNRAAQYKRTYLKARSLLNS